MTSLSDNLTGDKSHARRITDDLLVLGKITKERKMVCSLGKWRKKETKGVMR